MNGEQILLVRHQAPLRAVGETEALAVLSEGDRAVPRRDVLIDTRPYQEDVEGGHWRASHAYIRQVAATLRSIADAAETARIDYFSMAEVPHVIALGAYVGDERHVNVHDYNRDADDWKWPESGQTLQAQVLDLPKESVSQSGPVVIRVEISFPIADADVDAVIGPERLADVKIRPAGNPIPGVVRSAADVS
ncbi:MAG: SAVED domain-containing protein, partial [Gemmatimonadales bacterium]|nr:SAVED domain-containing protein [Gemmatimonadales bacterium]